MLRLISNRHLHWQSHLSVLKFCKEEPHSERCSLIPDGGIELLTCVCSAGALQHGSQPDEARLSCPSILADHDSALRYWEEHCFDGSTMQENRRLLRQHYQEAKCLGDQVKALASCCHDII